MSTLSILWILCGPINFYLFLKLAKRDNHYLSGEDILTACFFSLFGVSGLTAIIIVLLIGKVNLSGFDFWKSMNRIAKYLDNKFFS